MVGSSYRLLLVCDYSKTLTYEEVLPAVLSGGVRDAISRQMQTRERSDILPWVEGRRQMIEMLVNYGLTKAHVANGRDSIKLRYWVLPLLGYLKKRNDIYSAIITGDWADLMPSHLMEAFNTVVGNIPKWNCDYYLTGEHLIVGENKHERLMTISKEIGVLLSHTVVIADGRNDYKMMELVARNGGLAVAVEDCYDGLRKIPNIAIIEDQGDAVELMQQFERKLYSPK